MSFTILSLKLHDAWRFTKNIYNFYFLYVYGYVIRILQWLFDILFGHIDDIYIYTDLYIYSHQYVRFTTSVIYIYIFEIYYSDILMARKILYSVIDVTDSYIICSHQISHFLVFSILYLNGWKFWKILWYRVSADEHLRYYVVKLRGHQNGRLTYIYIYKGKDRKTTKSEAERVFLRRKTK